jgi:hypothetical protein
MMSPCYESETRSEVFSVTGPHPNSWPRGKKAIFCERRPNFFLVAKGVLIATGGGESENSADSSGAKGPEVVQQIF